VKIRRLHPEDFQRGFLETLAALRPVNLEPDQAREIFHRQKNEKVFVVLDKDQVVGTATLLIDRKYIHSGGIVGHVEDVAIHKDHQGKKIGNLLLSRLIKEAKKVGCYKLVLCCDDEVVDFYKKNGFAISANHMRLNLI
jgi:glucosamine-phosphate N-acetyltransferase